MQMQETQKTGSECIQEAMQNKRDQEGADSRLCVIQVHPIPCYVLAASQDLRNLRNLRFDNPHIETNAN